MAAEPRVLSDAETRILDLGNELWNDRSDRGRTFREAAKAKYPDAVTPEDQIEPILTPFRDEVKALREELAAEREAKRVADEAAAAAAAELSLGQRIDQAAGQFRLTDAGRQMMVDRMKETGNYTDPFAAAAYIVQANPPPPDIGGMLGPQHLNLFGTSEEAADERVRLLHKDPQGKFLDAEFTDFLRDPDQYVRDAGLAA